MSQVCHPLIAVVGPTGTGKSELALRIAEEFRGEVVNCDSLQIYRHFDIGTAKLPEAERRGVPHHLIGIVDPDEVFTAGEYARRGREALRDIAGRGLVPVVAGGTGFYLRALVEGLFTGPLRDEDLRKRLSAREAKRPGSLHRLLSRFDPEAARRIHAHDVQKLTRAVEICVATRRPISSWFSEGRDALKGFQVLKLGLGPAREKLYQRLDIRCGRMFAGGLVDEVRGILSLGFPPAAKPFESHGYRQAVEFLRGETSIEEAIERAQRNTRRYAKRQWTWFRKEPDIAWLAGFGEEPNVQDEALHRAETFFRTLQAFR